MRGQVRALNGRDMSRSDEAALCHARVFTLATRGFLPLRPHSKKKTRKKWKNNIVITSCNAKQIDKFQAVIFDMDGLLLDTEKIALKAFFEACRQFDFEPSLDIYLRCVGTNPVRTKVILTQGYGASFPFDKISPVWGENYRKAITELPIPVKTGAKEFLNFVKNSGKRTAIATSTAHQTARDKLERAGLISYFELIVGGDQVAKGKPDPETYLKVSKLLGVLSRHCLVLEDSDNGVLAAHGAGMSVIQIPDLKEPSMEVKSLGHPVLSSFKEVEEFLKIT